MAFVCVASIHFFLKFFVRSFLLQRFRSQTMKFSVSDRWCRQNTSHETFSRTHFTLFTCTAWSGCHRRACTKPSLPIHMSSMFDERSLIFPRFHSASLLSSTSFLPTPTSTTSASENPATITRNVDHCGRLVPLKTLTERARRVDS